VSEISGDTTTIACGMKSAGSWQQSDFPPAVGRMPTTSRPVQHGVEDLALARAESGDAEAPAGLAREA
jgi:hypothetical protein